LGNIKILHPPKHSVMTIGSALYPLHAYLSLIKLFFFLFIYLFIYFISLIF